MKLTDNFSKWEFDSNDGSEMPDHILENVNKLAFYLQVIRDHFNAPITINSGYRSLAHNQAVDGEDDSYHLRGVAGDIVVHGKSPKEVYRGIEELTAKGYLPEGGMKAYSTFVHWDYRGVRARW